MYMIHMSIEEGVGHFGENCMLQYTEDKNMDEIGETTMITLALVSVNNVIHI